MALHGGGDVRNRQHHHWLKGLIWCGRCGRRLIVMPGRGNGGTYFYFICRGRQDKKCDQPYLKMHDVEQAVEWHYATVRLSDEFRAEVRRQLDDTVLTELSSIDTLRKRLATLDSKEGQLLDLVGEPGWPQAKLKSKLDDVARERTEIEGQLADTATKLDAGREFFLTALELLSDPQGFYCRGNAKVKHALTKVIFSKLYINKHETARVSGHDLADGFGDLVEAEAQHRTAYRRSGGVRDQNRPRHDSNPLAAERVAADDLASDADLLAAALLGHGSSRDLMVELRGIEPLTYSMRTSRATNCATAPVRCTGAYRVARWEFYQPVIGPPRVGIPSAAARPGRAVQDPLRRARGERCPAAAPAAGWAAAGAARVPAP
jgi:site-specific DNA recombinase